MELRFGLLLVCFVVSGFAALLYQTAWTREFAFLFGTSELAVVAVLAAYMGGLALGAAAAARFVGRLTRPILAYGVIELGIAICALGVPYGIAGVQSIYLGFAGGLDAPPESLPLTTALFHLAGAFLVLVPCTALMGATLPLLARYAVSDDEQIGPRIGVLYSVNTLGAIAGTLVAAFVFLPEFGLRHTVYIGIAGNAVVFLAAAALASGVRGIEPESAFVNAGARSRFHWILPAMLLSGAVSFVYEVLWTRLLGQVLGGSTAAFSSMLASFLLGIALGSAIASRFAKTRDAAAVGFVLSQVGIGVLAWIAFRASEYLPDLAHAVGAHPAAPAPGAAAAGIVLLPLTLCIGATFPFGVRILARDAEEAATVSGRVYAWNTVGSIIGAILAGFALLPLIGLENTALVGVATSLLLAIAAALFVVPRRRVLAGVAAVALLVGLGVGLPVPSRLLMHSAISGDRMQGELVFLGVGRSATVTVLETLQGWKLYTNGLPESGVDREEVPDLRFNETAWLSLLPTAARPETDRMLIIGLGAGRTLDATASTVSHIDMIELEEEVVTANRLIPRPNDPLDQPRVHLRVGDARGAMHLTDARYDAIVSQPSHPWTSGASHLYTREFFELAQSKLEPGGIFIQWIGANFVDNELFGNLMASMTDVFAHVQVYRPVSAAIVFMASDQPIDLAKSAPAALAASPDDFARQGIHQLEDFYASWTLNNEGVRALAAGRPLNSDDHNRLATRRLPPARAASGLRMQKLNASFAEQDPLTPEVLATIDATALARRMALVGIRDRVNSVVSRLPGRTDQLAARGWLLIDQGQLKKAARVFRSALLVDRSHPAARAGYLIASPDGVGILGELRDIEAVIHEAHTAEVDEDRQALEALDERLSQIHPGDHFYTAAVRARQLWRVTSGDAELAREARELIDQLLTRERTIANYLLRANAAAVAGEDEVAWSTLDTIASRPRMSRVQAGSAIAIGRMLGESPERRATMERLTALARARQ